MNAKYIFFRAPRGMIDATHLNALPSAACNSCARATSVSWLRHCLEMIPVAALAQYKYAKGKDVSTRH